MNRRTFIGASLIVAGCTTTTDLMAPETVNGLFEYYRGIGGWRWRLKAGNNKCIAESGQSYSNKDDCISAIKLVQKSSTAEVRFTEIVRPCPRNSRR